jgi:hypothetical protein
MGMVEAGDVLDEDSTTGMLQPLKAAPFSNGIARFGGRLGSAGFHKDVCIRQRNATIIRK